MRQASLFSPFNWAPPAESHCDGALHANARHTTGNVPGELNASYKSPPKTNSMTRLRRVQKTPDYLLVGAFSLPPSKNFSQ